MKLTVLTLEDEEVLQIQMNAENNGCERDFLMVSKSLKGLMLPLQ